MSSDKYISDDTIRTLINMESSEKDISDTFRHIDKYGVSSEVHNI